MLPYTTYLIDLDGVIYRGNELLPGAKEFVAWLEANNKKYLFLTNNSFASEDQVLEKLAAPGYYLPIHPTCSARVRRQCKISPAVFQEPWSTWSASRLCTIC